MGLFTFRSQYVFLNTQPPIGLEEALDKIPEARGYETLALPHESATKKIFLEGAMPRDEDHQHWLLQTDITSSLRSKSQL